MNDKYGRRSISVWPATKDRFDKLTAQIALNTGNTGRKTGMKIDHSTVTDFGIACAFAVLAAVERGQPVDTGQLLKAILPPDWDNLHG